MELMQSAGNKNSVNSGTLAVFGALCLFLSAVEYMIPKPLPFMRIGLANLPLMMALDIFPFPSFFILTCIKVLGQALITGTLFSYVFLFSLTGTFLSGFLMYILRRIFGNRITFIGIGCAGAMVSNVSQLALAWFLVFKAGARYIAPPFLFAGLVTGIMLGIFCEVFTKRSNWYLTVKTCRDDIRIKNSVSTNDVPDIPKKQNLCEKLFSAGALFITGLIVIPAFLLNPSTEFRVLQFLFFLVLVILSGKKINLLLTIVFIAVIVIFNLFIHYGQVIFAAGSIRITSGALTAGIHRAVTFSGLIMLSKLSIRRDLKIPGAFGKLLNESMRIFSVMMSRKNRAANKNPGKTFIEKIDNMLSELTRENITGADAPAQKTTPAGYVILAVVIIISWLPWLPVLLN